MCIRDRLVMIRDNNCADLIQGYIFGTPMPKGAFLELATKLSKPRKQLAESGAKRQSRSAQLTH